MLTETVYSYAPAAARPTMSKDTHTRTYTATHTGGENSKKYQILKKVKKCY
eukprot:NODE_13547_length_190_cov_0.723404_g12932_i0.p2 GENE.NODE_13547_length_190_cov_0.723404_g12932_i0~~NODE_13547_length_190_cov_0.723404_g12932_i0.p2  ORF type:complete len:51 (-),score=9.72 NODE_13547_length_190_cov_0.723404_g12932_i0:3-155(-)